MGIELNTMQQTAWDLLRRRENVFITGPGGTGKSFFLKHVISAIPDSLIVAPTGIAALNVDGSTIHKVFELPTHILTEEDYYAASYKLKDLIRKTKLLVIDEISMVRADVFTCMDKRMRSATGKNKPFGGIQIVLIGDFFQLAPVLTNDEEETFYGKYASTFAFGTDSWKEANLRKVEFTEVRRQSDKIEISALNVLRTADTRRLQGALNWINDKCHNNKMPKHSISLCKVNRIADDINMEHFSNVEASTVEYNASISGDFPNSIYPVPSNVLLKKGCRVLICANGTGYVNGNTGTLVEMERDHVRLLIDNHKHPVKVTANTWTRYSYTTQNNKISKNVIGTFTQLPIKLGWAVTIHKSQGMTLESMCLNLGRKGSWVVFGQTYTGISRVRSFDNLSLARPIYPGDLVINDEVEKFYQSSN